MKDLKNKTVLITGGAGFIGRNLIEELKSHEAHVINVSKSRQVDGIENILIDLTKTDFSFLDELSLDYIVHLAACSSPRRSKSDRETLEINYESTKRLFEKISSLDGIKKTIFLSSSAVYQESKEKIKEGSSLEVDGNAYTKSKILTEDAAKQFINRGLKFLVFRMSNAYGPYQQWKEEDVPTLIPQLISEAVLNRKIEIFNGKPIRDYIYVMDVVSAIILGLKSSYSGILNLGTGIETSSGTLANLIGKTLSCPVYDLGLKVAGSEKAVLDTEKLKKELGFSPKYNLENGLRKTIKYYSQILGK